MGLALPPSSSGSKILTPIEYALQFSSGSAALDAYARLRISNPFTVFDSKQIANDGDIADSAENAPLFWDNQETSGSGTATLFDADRASTALSVSNTTAGTRVRQTRQSFNYQPGKSQLIYFTGILGAGSSGITARYGSFNANNGLFFQTVDGTASVVRRSHVTGSPVNEVVAQADWNIDTMDGSGNAGGNPSRLTLDLDKTQIFMIDYEWLGVGRARFGVVIDGIPFYVHEFKHANDLTAVYMSTPNLPIRGEITNDGTGAAATLELNCVTIVSEGGVDENGITHSHNNEATKIAMASAANRYALLGIRLRSSHIGITTILEKLSVVSTSANDSMLWSLHFNPTVADTFNFSNLGNSALQVATGVAANTLSADGTILDSGYVATSAPLVSGLLHSSVELGALIDGTVDEIVLAARPLVNNVDVFASLSWRELV